jgi:hypothetical protein
MRTNQQSEDLFSTSTEGLPDAVSTSAVQLHDGDSLNVHVRPVRKRINDAVVRMLAYTTQ